MSKHGSQLKAEISRMPGTEPLILPHGGYRTLKSFQLAQLAYDLTVRFADRYINPRSRTHDQMVQAARSGVQNIAEGSKASGTSKKTELKLTNVARASLEELRLDYEDFLRHRRLPLWVEDDPRRAELVARRCATADAVAAWVRDVHEQDERNGLDGPDGPPNRGRRLVRRDLSIKSIWSIPATRATYAEIAANAALVLIGVACALLDRQIAAQAAAFEAEGGFYRAAPPRPHAAAVWGVKGGVTARQLLARPVISATFRRARARR